MYDAFFFVITGYTVPFGNVVTFHVEAQCLSATKQQPPVLAGQENRRSILLNIANVIENLVNRSRKDMPCVFRLAGPNVQHKNLHLACTVQCDSVIWWIS